MISKGGPVIYSWQVAPEVVERGYTERSARFLPEASRADREPEQAQKPARRRSTRKGSQSARRRTRRRRGGLGSSVYREALAGKSSKILQLFGGLVLGCIKTKVCKRIYAFDSIIQALQDVHTFAPFQTQHFSKKSV